MKAAFKRWIKALLFRPLRIRMGPNSVVMLPRWLHNPANIQIGKDCYVGRFSILHPLASHEGRLSSGQIVLGNDVYVGGFVQIHALGRVEIGDGSVLSEHVYISDIAHGLHPSKGPIMKQPLESKGPVKIGRNVFIGFGSSVLPGVNVGDHCVVGTRSVVTRSFPPYSMIAGSPAKLIKVFDQAAQEWVPPVPSPSCPP